MKIALIFFLFYLMSFNFGFSQDHTIFTPSTLTKPKLPVTKLSSAEDNIHWADNFAFTNFVGSEVPAVAFVGNDIYIVRGGHIYKFDGSTRLWEVIGIINYGRIYSFYVHDEKLYIAGSFTQINGEDLSGAVIWDGENFSQVGNGLIGSIRAIVVSNSGKIYVGGSNIIFDDIGSNLWIWNGDDWENPYYFDGGIYALAEFDGKIYIGGNFTGLSNPDINNIAVYDESGTEPDPLGSGINGIVRCIATGQFGEVYIGGNFSNESDTLINNIAKLEDDKWTSLSSGVNGNINAIEISDNKIITGGLFDRAGGKEIHNLAAWDGNEWFEAGVELSGGQVPTVLSLSSYLDGLIVGGTFKKAGDIFAYGFAYWDGLDWIDLFDKGNDGVNSVVHDMVIGSDGNLYVGGAFNNVGNNHSPGLAMWDGENWAALKQGLQDPGIVYSMVSVENDIYFTGWFPGAYTIELNNVAIWKIDRQDWEDVGGGIDGGDNDLGPIAYTDGQFFVGGRFDSAGTIKSKGIVKWDGSRWMAMDKGVKSEEDGFFSVEVLEIDQAGMLYCAGRFDSVGTESSMGLGIWNPLLNRWFGLGEIINGTVYAMAISDPWVYIGGEFTEAIGKEVTNLIRLNWQTFEVYSLGTGTNGPVYSILEYGGHLFIGGRFTEASGMEVNSIVKYDIMGQSFEPLGSGIKNGVDAGTVLSLNIFKDKLYAGGLFTSAGGKLSNNIAVWDDLPPNSIKEEPLSGNISSYAFPNPFSQFTIINLQLSIPGNVVVKVYDVFGNKITTLVNEYQGAGSHLYQFNAGALPSGVYYYKIQSNANVETGKVVLVR